MRVVFDTNVIVSRAIVQAGKPARLFQHWREGTFELLVSEEILSECRRVLKYPRISKRHRYTDAEIEQLLSSIKEFAVLVEPETALRVVEDDPDDNRILECAVAGAADYIVSGDNHLLDLRRYQGIQVLSPAAFLLLLSAGSRPPAPEPPPPAPRSPYAPD